MLILDLDEKPGIFHLFYFTYYYYFLSLNQIFIEKEKTCQKKLNLILKPVKSYLRA